MAKILGIGNVVLDIVLSVDHTPQEDEEMRAHKREVQVGGNVANTLYVLNQLGHETAISATVGGDQEAKQILNGLKAHQIQTEHLQRYIQGRTPTSYITLESEKGHRTIVHYRDLPELSFEHFAKIEIEDYDWLHFEARNIDNLKGMLNIAKTFLTHQPISLEVEKARKGVEALLPQANVIFFSHHYAKQKGYSNAEALLNEMKKQLPQATLICTWSTEGVGYCAPNGPVQHQAAKTLPKAVDTLGAGDTFNAGVIDALLNQHPLDQAIEKGIALAARKCQQYGFDNLMTPITEAKPFLANIKQLSPAKTLVVPQEGYRGGIILIKDEEEVKAYENNCPHQDVPLNEAYKIDVNPFEKTMKCSVHDAYFQVEDGYCIEGPCMGEALSEIPIRVDEKGDIYLKNP
ncbi:PfkB family carbohydrate kinase [Galenea microaerophila]